ncbi:thioredoxin family protein [Adhaeretor mobilis]|uniref:Thioredoxin n=1 Tax=Adhaeretor mobilis TaxID=1930276 RepID=A0A517MV17_9BACT|nr:thioredoxin family protein [Adhaeretor mobilis]QDS98730.1 Thioredoxin [Adhaeretor mobilis]
MNVFVRSGLAGLVISVAVTTATAEEPATTQATPDGKAPAVAPSQAAAAESKPTVVPAAISDGRCKARPLQHGVFRFTRYPAAWTAAQKTGRPILIFATSQQCPYCVKMIEGTYKQKHITQLVAGSFETVYVDRHAQPELVKKLNIKWYPTTIVVTPGNKVVAKIEGYVEPNAFTTRIHTSLASAAKKSKLAEAAKTERK